MLRYDKLLNIFYIFYQTGQLFIYLFIIIIIIIYFFLFIYLCIYIFMHLKNILYRRRKLMI